MTQRSEKREPLDARACAERILALRDHGREELARKLAARGFDPALIRETLDELAQRGYLDDDRTAAGYARGALEKGHGAVYVHAKLAGRGFRIEADPCTPEEEAESLKKLLKRWRIGPDALTDRAGRAKLSRRLAARGYRSATISEVLRSGMVEDSEE